MVITSVRPIPRYRYRYRPILGVSAWVSVSADTLKVSVRYPATVLFWFSHILNFQMSSNECHDQWIQIHWKQSHKDEFAMATFLDPRYLGNFFKDPRTIIWVKVSLKMHLKYCSLVRTYPLSTFSTKTCWNTKSYVGILNSGIGIGIGIGIGDFLASASVSVSVSVFGYRSYTRFNACFSQKMLIFN